MIEQNICNNSHIKSIREFHYSLDVMHFKSSQDTLYIIPINGNNIDYLCQKNQDMKNLWKYSVLNNLSVKIFENGKLITKTLEAGTELLATNCLHKKPYHITAISPFNKHHAFILDISDLSLIDTNHPYFHINTSSE